MPDGDKKQFNVYLPPDLIRAVKFASINTGQSLSSFVEEALQLQLMTVDEARRAAEAHVHAMSDGKKGQP